MNAPEKLDNVVSLHEAADALIHDSAVMEIGWDLKDGKEVNGVSLLGLLDSELDNRVISVHDLLEILTNYEDRHLLSDRLVDGIIERFLSTPKGKEAMEERKERPYEPDPMDWQDE